MSPSPRRKTSPRQGQLFDNPGPEVRQPLPLPDSLIQEASAGTGKTFALSSRYLRLIFGGASPSSILAATFTRAAAGEILDRVVARLADAAADEAAAATLGQQLGIAIDRGTALEQLVRLMQNIHELRIGTIDSFFFQVAAGWGLELGLPAGWTIGDEDQLQAGRDFAVQQVLAQRGTDDLLNLLSHTDGDRSVAGALASLVENLYFLYQQAPDEAWEPAGDAVRPLKEGELEAAADALESIGIARAGLAKAVAKDIGLIRQGDLRGLCKSTLLGNVMAGDLTYSRAPIPGEIVDAYRSLGDLVHRGIVHLNRQRTRSARELLDRFAASFRGWEQRQGLIGFDDLPRLVQPLTGKNGEGMRLRLDGGIDHLLLDEFQDTSPLQWAVLEPIARERLAAGDGTFFCVGDPKQSIFSWRGGVAEMFDVVRQQFQKWIHEAAPLLKSRRSAPPVIDAVNQVFGRLQQVPWTDPISTAALQAWQRWYQPHETVHEGLPGSVRFLRATDQGSGNGPEPAADSISLATVEAVRRMAGDPDRSIGLLVRRHEDIATLVFLLRQAGIPCSEEGGNPLTDAVAVNVILAALTLADHPGDTAAAWMVLHSPLGRLLELETPAGPRDAAFLGSCRRASRLLRQRLADAGYGRTCQWLAGALFESATQRERGRIELLVNLATQYDLRWSPRPTGFVQLARSTRVPDPTSAGVRVMTLHKSKGLEFDAVVLPLYGSRAGWSSGHRPQMVYSRDPDSRQIRRIVRYENQDLRGFLPPADQAVFDEYAVTEAREALCLLYVGMTRAVRDLTIIVGEKAMADTTSVEGLLLATLGSLPGATPDEPVIWQCGDPAWHSRPAPSAGPGRSRSRKPADRPAPRPDSPHTIPDGPHPPLAGRPDATRSGRGLPWIAPSRHGRDHAVTGADLLRISRPTQLSDRADALPSTSRSVAVQPDARAWGSAIHSLLQLVEWTDQPGELDRILASIASATAEHQQSEELIRQFSGILAAPAVAALLSRPATLARVERLAGGRLSTGETELTVRNEFPLVFERDGRMMEGSIDRIVLAKSAGRLVAAELLDYKTDRIPESAIASRAAHYRPQIESYIHAAAAMLGLPTTVIGAQLVFLAPGMAVSIRANG